jgi:hypothetical protein
MSLGVEKRELYKLTEIAYRVIKHEKLPKPSEIKFRNPVSGVKRNFGSCHKIGSGEDSRYSIIVSTIKTKFFPDSNGNIICKKTGQRFRKAAIGEEMPFEEIKDTLAHEIAHLKFWNHSPQHKNYTQYLLKEINKWWY